MRSFECGVGLLLSLLVAFFLTTECEADDMKQEPEMVLLRGIELRSESLVPLDQHNRLQVAPTDKTPAAELTVNMIQKEYGYQLVVVKEDGSKRETTGSVLCYELRSKGATPYVWVMWSHRVLGHFRLFSHGTSKNVLTWVEGSTVVFTEVSASKDPLVDFMVYVGGRRQESYGRIPITDMIPEAKTWGVNALYHDIVVQSLKKDAAGRITATISGPNASQDYLLIFEAGKWHREDRGGAGPTVGGN